MAVNPSPFGPKPQFELADGTPAVGGQLFFYVAGSVNTKQDTYTDSSGGSANTNPIVLNALGEPTTEIWFTAGLSYKVVYAPAGDTDPPSSPIWTIDDLLGINDVSVAQDQWVAFAGAPTFINGTSFTLVGDQTSTFHIGRRIKTTNSGGTIYSTIINSAFGAVTTVTVRNDSGSLDVGLSAVSYGLMSFVNTSWPPLIGQRNAQTGVSYTLLPSDYGKVITLTNAGAITLGVTAAASLGSGWWCWIKNIGASTVTIDPNGAETISFPGGPQTPGTTMTLPYSGSTTGPYNVSGVMLWCDGTGFQVLSTLETHGSELTTTPGTDSWTCPAGVTTVWITGCAGGGGGGGTSAGATNAGGGGGGGASVIRSRRTVVPGTSYTRTVGSAGSGGSSGNNGTNGGDSVFDTLTLDHGDGGANNGNGGAGGSGAGTISGGDGGNGTSGGGIAFAPGGGGSVFGQGGASGVGNGRVAGGFGGGGGGSGNSATASGANGTPGFILIEW